MMGKRCETNSKTVVRRSVGRERGVLASLATLFLARTVTMLGQSASAETATNLLAHTRATIRARNK